VKVRCNWFSSGLAIAIVPFMLVYGSAAPTAALDGLSGPKIRPEFDRDVVAVSGSEDKPEQDSLTPLVASDDEQPPAVVMLPACPENSPNTGTDVQCPASGVACPQGMTRLFVWTAAPGTQFGQPGWTQAGNTCGNPAAPGAAVVVPALSAQEFQRLPLPAGVAKVQPGSGRVLIRVPTNVFVTVEPVTLETVLLGFPVQVRATPSRYSWDFGDGTVLPTRDPGAAYPDLRVTHSYEGSGSYGITLTTFYTGEYSVAGGPWLPVPGEAQVDSEPVAVQAVGGRNELVAEPLP